MQILCAAKNELVFEAFKNHLNGGVSDKISIRLPATLGGLFLPGGLFLMAAGICVAVS
jgi:hypothetical protein